jgi:hypothetical protein
MASTSGVVLVGSRDRGRWGRLELDDALYKHCESQKPLILFLLSDASGLEPDLNNWLGKRYKWVLPEPLYVVLPGPLDLKGPDIMGLLSGHLGSKSFKRILSEVVKLLRLRKSWPFPVVTD